MMRIMLSLMAGKPYFHQAHCVSLQSFPCLDSKKLFIKQIFKRRSLVFEDHRNVRLASHGIFFLEKYRHIL